MNKTLVLMYLNMTLGRPIGMFTLNDAKMMSMRMNQKMKHYMAPDMLLQVALNSPVSMRNHYLEGMWNSLINDYDIKVETNLAKIIVKYS